jgi:hypothetical protein
VLRIYSSRNNFFAYPKSPTIPIKVNSAGIAAVSGQDLIDPVVDGVGNEMFGNVPLAPKDALPGAAGEKEIEKPAS